MLVEFLNPLLSFLGFSLIEFIGLAILIVLIFFKE